MEKKINWYAGKNALNPADMQDICNNLEKSTSPENLAEIIKGGDEVVVDIAEDGNSLDLHLDNVISNKINNSLQIPAQAPTATELVAVGANNAQTMLGIGEGLSVNGGKLSVNGGKLTSPLYLHNITFSGTGTIHSAQIHGAFYVISAIEEAYKRNTIVNLLPFGGSYPCNGVSLDNDGISRTIYRIINNGISCIFMTVYCADAQINVETETIEYANATEFSDLVVPLI